MPIALCVILASKLRGSQVPVGSIPADPSPLPVPADTVPPPPAPTRAVPSADALTTASVFSDVQMVTAHVGWAWGADTVLSRTDDGGRTWTAVGPTGCDHFVQGSLRAWVVTCDSAGGRVHSTTDGGKTWSYAAAMTTEPRTPISARSLQFTDANSGVVELNFGVEGEETFLYRTRDGGRTWRKLGDSPWNAMTSFTDASRGWRISENRVLERTTDGGDTWTAHRDLVACAVDTLPSFEGDTGILVGSCPSGLHAFYTSDAGEHWLASAKVDVDDPAVAMHGGAQAWLWSTGDALVHTSDGGRTLDTSPGLPVGSTFQIVSPSLGFAMQTVDDDLVVSRSIDGGRTFSAVLTTSAPNDQGLSFSDAEHGVLFTAFASGTRILSTSDGGTSWRFLRP